MYGLLIIVRTVSFGLYLLTDKGPCSRYIVNWKNPFNNFNFDGTVNCSNEVNWGNDIFVGIDRINFITEADPEFDVYGSGRIDFDEDPGGEPVNSGSTI